MFYGNCVKMYEDFALKNWLLHRHNAPSHSSFFTRECLTKSNMTIVPHPPYFYLFPQLKIKLTGHYFDTLEVSKAEPQVNGVCAWKGTTSRVMVAIRPKVSF
jgi:hypothetical protein